MYQLKGANGKFNEISPPSSLRHEKNLRAWLLLKKDSLFFNSAFIRQSWRLHFFAFCAGLLIKLALCRAFGVWNCSFKLGFLGEKRKKKTKKHQEDF